ncbi:type VI secretion system-associated protein TagF [Agrobacterium radiobacter]|uniref:Serine/threonine phosphoprotein phosphatase n=1 Tax=Agrobacterium tumefaciens str. Kerr 14 TaxID=1183424 RepID=A0A1S7S8S8_AGRTU|nr:type VI secretion system-associated protein TagF [Agrobacterium tumefaciens]AYM84311.1 type VI secretion system protein ImpM [Agrobacterium tumefaciens]MBP2510879.1 type VI secretion system protein ImpM [Agrobacterium tumefaciens]MBP2519922.1 type VI secretion system protein ImpM [Agrobacterium tumefaciens]MBP2578592.1 type VI secretion system protein ImpM [Agrobacterium tumefaciens]MBP2596885.1 type VI secretion system protein ImpM [Agrobacterium tumefaciens]
MANQASRPAESAAESDRIGFFGKVPSHGDFISDGLERELIGTFDDWMRSGLHACADTFAGRWSEIFASSPPIRFIIESGIWGNSAYAGVLVPSADRVGRKYPLAIVAQLNNFRKHPRTLYLDDTWFMAAEALAETSMTGDFDMSRFNASVKKLRPPKPREEDDTQEMVRNRVPTSLWWHIDPISRRARGLKFDGKPKASDFLRLFSDMTGKGDEDGSAPAQAPESVKQKTPPIISPAPSTGQPAPVIYSYATHPGTRLSLNADSLFVSQTPTLFAIADGQGDTHSAAEAARLVTNILAETPDAETPEVMAQQIRGKLGTVNSLLLSRQAMGADGRPMASVVIASIFGRRLSVLWSGDARAYLLKNGTMHQLSRDHVVIGMKKQLSQCVGLSQQFRPDIVGEDWSSQDRLLLCSYPLVQILKERAIAEIVGNTPIKDCASALIQEALIEDARENVSAIVIGNRLEQG